jgi:hypothetical protein
VGRIPGGRWRRLTILGAIACDGLVAVMTVAAATSTAVVLAFVEGLLIPAPRARPEVLVGMDNLAPHRAAAVRDALRRADLAHRYLPAYSPDMNHRRRRSPGGADREAVWAIPRRGRPRSGLEDRTSLGQAQAAGGRTKDHRGARRRPAGRPPQHHANIADCGSARQVSAMAEPAPDVLDGDGAQRCWHLRLQCLTGAPGASA